MRASILLPAALIAFSTPPSAAEWRSIAPDGGTVTTLFAHPTVRDRLWAISPEGDSFRSDDGASSWRRSSGDLPEPGILHFVASPAVPSTTWAASRTRLWKSLDGGASWSEVQLAAPIRFGREISALAPAPSDASSLYVATRDADPRVWRTRDGGSSWISSRMSCPSDVVVHPADPNWAYVRTCGGRLLRTRDGGVTWPEVAHFGDLTGLVLDVGSRSQPTLYASGSQAGLLRSRDGGKTWKSLVVGGNRVARITLLASSRAPGAGPGALLAGIEVPGSAPSQLWRSPDGGATWQRLLATSAISAVLEHPFDASRLFVAVVPIGVLRTQDGGRSWQPASRGLTASSAFAIAADPREPDRIYLSLVTEGTRGATSRGLWTSQDSGATWRRFANLVGAPAARFPRISKTLADPSAAGVLYALTDDAIFRTEDGGITWIELARGLPDLPSLVDLELDPRNPSTLYLLGYRTVVEGAFSTHCHTVAVSLDRGTHWDLQRGITCGDPYTGDGTTFDFLAVAATTPATIYLAGSGLARSRDAGVSWQLLAQPFTFTLQAHALLTDPAFPSDLYALSHHATWVSHDHGDTWTSAPISATARDLASSSGSDRTFYVATDAGVLTSADLLDGLQPLGDLREKVFSVVTDPHLRGRVYVTAVGDGKAFAFDPE